jgi:dTDP-glucose 4,6-dehydratase
MSTVRKIAVIGSNSFSGSDFIDLLLEDSDTQVLGISRSPEKSNLFIPYRHHGPERYSFRQLDLNDNAVEIIQELDAFEPEYIVNFAAQSEVGPSWDFPEQWFETNTVSLAKLLNNLRKRDYLKRYVHISSPEAYGTTEGIVTESAPLNPSTPYAASKAAADLLISTFVAHYGFPAITIRATNVYGARQQIFKIIPRSFIYMRLRKTIMLHGGGEAVKSFIHVRDVSRGELAAMERGRLGEIYHLSPQRGYSIREIVESISKLTGSTLDEVSQDVGERPGQDAAYVISPQKAQDELGWSTQITLEEGLSQVHHWVENNWEQIQKEPLEYEHQR